jgi:pimeloyl-ACP methyl ester carboxylesterase
LTLTYCCDISFEGDGNILRKGTLELRGNVGKYDQEFIEPVQGVKLAIRIYKKQREQSSSSFPIVLVHGLLNSSDLFDLPESDQMGLAETLMNEGFEVFTYDQRGAGQSTCQDWDFGMYENVLIDLPSVINYAMHYTGARKVILGGYSLGGIIIFLLVSYLTKTKSLAQNISQENIHKVFTMASPGMIMERSGKWKHLFRRGENILNKMGPVIDKTDF